MPPGKQDAHTIVTELEQFRAQKDTFFKTHPQSPLRPEQQETFEGLSYFPVNPALRLVVPIEEFTDKDRIEMQTTTGDVRAYARYGGLRFSLGDGQFLLDFNLAYNPYCAYNDAWSCPMTPTENRLRVPIRAGEKVFGKHV